MIHDPEPRPRPRPQQHRRHRRPHDQRRYQHSLVVDEGDSPPDGEGRGLEHKLAEGENDVWIERNGGGLASWAFRAKQCRPEDGRLGFLAVDVDGPHVAVKDIRSRRGDTSLPPIGLFLSRRRRRHEMQPEHSEGSLADVSTDAARDQHDGGYDRDDEDDGDEAGDGPGDDVKSLQGGGDDVRGGEVQRGHWPLEPLPPRQMRILHRGDRVVVRVGAGGSQAAFTATFMRLKYLQHRVEEEDSPSATAPEAAAAAADLGGSQARPTVDNLGDGTASNASIAVAAAPPPPTPPRKCSSGTAQRQPKAEQAPEANGQDDSWEEYSYLTGDVTMKDQGYISGMTGDEVSEAEQADEIALSNRNRIEEANRRLLKGANRHMSMDISKTTSAVSFDARLPSRQGDLDDVAEAFVRALRAGQGGHNTHENGTNGMDGVRQTADTVDTKAPRPTSQNKAPPPTLRTSTEDVGGMHLAKVKDTHSVERIVNVVDGCNGTDPKGHHGDGEENEDQADKGSKSIAEIKVKDPSRGGKRDVIAGDIFLTANEDSPLTVEEEREIDAPFKGEDGPGDDKRTCSVGKGNVEEDGLIIVGGEGVDEEIAEEDDGGSCTQFYPMPSQPYSDDGVDKSANGDIQSFTSNQDYDDNNGVALVDDEDRRISDSEVFGQPTQPFGASIPGPELVGGTAQRLEDNSANKVVEKSREDTVCDNRTEDAFMAETQPLFAMSPLKENPIDDDATKVADKSSPSALDERLLNMETQPFMASSPPQQSTVNTAKSISFCQNDCEASKSDDDSATTAGSIEPLVVQEAKPFIQRQGQIPVIRSGGSDPRIGEEALQADSVADDGESHENEGGNSETPCTTIMDTNRESLTLGDKCESHDVLSKDEARDERNVENENKNETVPPLQLVVLSAVTKSTAASEGEKERVRMAETTVAPPSIAKEESLLATDTFDNNHEQNAKDEPKEKSIVDKITKHETEKVEAKANKNEANLLAVQDNSARPKSTIDRDGGHDVDLQVQRDPAEDPSILTVQRKRRLRSQSPCKDEEDENNELGGDIRVIITGITVTEKHRKMVKAINATLIETADKAATATHAIAGDGKVALRRTPKLMICLCKTANILDMKWLTQSAKVKRGLNCDAFLLLGEKEAEKTYNFLMEETLKSGIDVRKQRGGLLGGLSVYFSKGVAGNKAPPENELSLIVHAAGGTQLKSISARSTKGVNPSKIIIITSDPPTSAQKLEKNAQRLVSLGSFQFTSSWLFHCIITQRLFGITLNDGDGGNLASPRPTSSGRGCKRKSAAKTPLSSRRKKHELG